MNDFKIYELTEDDIEEYVGSHGQINPSNVNEEDRINLLKTAVFVNDIELVRECIAIGISISDPLLLENSAYYGNYEIVEMLLKAGADPTGAGCIALLVSKARCHYKVHNLINQYLRSYKLNQILNDHDK